MYILREEVEKKWTTGNKRDHKKETVIDLDGVYCISIHLRNVSEDLG